MSSRLELIADFLAGINDLVVTVPFIVENNTIKGTVAVTVETRTEHFDVMIHQQYPFQFHNFETIRFINKGLINVNHVNGDGSICVHTQHSPDILQKLYLDFDSLKAWMKKYLIDDENDHHYEHVVVPKCQVNGINPVMLFTEVDYKFNNGDFGNFKFSLLADDGIVNDINTTTYILQSITHNSKEYRCKWNEHYQSLKKLNGLFVYFDTAPVKNNRFIIENWEDFNGVLSQEFLNLLQTTEQQLKQSNYEKLTLLIGYPIKSGETHWQTISIQKSKFPLYREEIKGARRFFIQRLKKQEILWGETRNCSYDYFFGRGALSSQLTKSKIMVLGLGAIGSMVANTLCRGGATSLHLIDFDAKEPGNICRSEYAFFSGINDKVTELRSQLTTISPFIEATGNTLITDAVKLFKDDLDFREKLRSYFNEYDLIFDCTADNDMAYLLDELGIENEIINLSITNKAKELVCVTKPNLYNVLMHIFTSLDKSNIADLYNPSGCWAPTFKAGL